MTLYRVRVQAEIVATFEVHADTPENAAYVTAAVNPTEVKWLTPGRVVAIEVETPKGWRALTPEETALVEALEQ